MPDQVTIPWADYYRLGQMIHDIIQQIQGLIDPIKQLIDEFQGRPTIQATADIATILNNYDTPTLKFLALGAADLLRLGIPISSPQAGAIFGPYFKAALDIECGIRWSTRTAGIERVEDQTLTAALHEAGNPGVAGTATLTAIQQAYNQFVTGNFPTHVSPLQYFTTMAQEPGTDPASLMEKGWVNSYYGNIVPPPPPVPTPPPPKPPPPPGRAPGTTPGVIPPQYSQQLGNIIRDAPPGRPILIDGVQTGKYAVEWYDPSQSALDKYFPGMSLGAMQQGTPPVPPTRITMGLQEGATVSGDVVFIATFQGGPFPQAHADWLLDNQLVYREPAPTTETNERVTTGFQFDTRTIINGQHTLIVKWIGHLGTVHAQHALDIKVDNKNGGGGHNGHPPPPPPPRNPPPEIPWQDWFKVCAEVPQCDHISNDYLSLAQSVSNIAYAVYNLPQLWRQEPPDPCCDRIVAAIALAASELTVSINHMAALPNPAVLEPPLHAAAEALAGINKALGGVGPDFSGLEKTLETALKPLHDIAAKMDAECCDRIVAQLKRLNDDMQVPEDWKRALLDSKSLPPALSGLIQSTTWDVIAATAGTAVGHVLGWGESEIEGAAEKIGRFIIHPVIHFIGVLWKNFMKGFEPEGGPAAADFERVVKALLKYLDEIVTGLFGFVASTAVEAYEAGVEGIDTNSPAGVQAATKLLLGRALEMGTSAHLVANLAELVPFTKNIGLNQTAAFIAELAGFREVLVNTHRPFLYTKLGRPATYVFNRKFPTALPPAPAAFGWWARRLLSDADVKYAAASAGYADHWDATMHRAAYRPISPRALTTLMQDQPFDKVRMREILQDNSYSDAHVDFMLDELDYASTKNVRNSYVSEALTAYKAGVMPDSELNDILDSLGWSPEAKKFVHERALLARRVTLAAKVELQVTGLVAQGLLSPEVGLQHMEAAGIQDWYARLEITLATTKAELTAARKEATEAHRAELAKQRNLTRAAVAEYQAGRVNTPELTVALHAIGLDNTLVASITALEEALRAGRVKLTFGQLLAPEASAVLKEQVAAIEQQFKDNLLPFASTYNQLTALKVPPAEAHALVARWAASLKKTPGAALLVNPITGQLETHVAG